MLALASAPAVVGYAPTPMAPSSLVTRTSSPVMETASDLESLATKLNPLIGFYDPLNLSGADFWGKGEEATVGWLRHAEIKHGRVAMAAFVGYCVQSTGFHFPWALGGGVTYADIAAAGAPPDQWDALPTAAKLQILGFIGFLEYVGENSYAMELVGEKHYMKGGKPGFYPPLKTPGIVPHPVPFNLYQPFGSTKMTEEQKANRLVAEINNGRLAMLGIFGFVSASKGLIVPGLDGVIPPYSGEYMAYFSSQDVGLPLVSDMLKFPFY